MKIINSIYSFIIAILFAFPLQAQITIVDLESNPTIKNFLLKNPHFSTRSKSIDTLNLPFFEDFVYEGPFPSTNNWTDNYVFVNRSHGKNAPSHGVATFDALNQSGELYEEASSSPFLADVLSSNYINLKEIFYRNPISISTTILRYYDSESGTYFGADSLWYFQGFYYNCLTGASTYTLDLPIYYLKHPENTYISTVGNLYYWDANLQQNIKINEFLSDPYEIADSLYLSFFYQPQGLTGNAPESTDSLILEFRTDTINWHSVWKTHGTAVHDFKQVLIPINQPQYLSSTFRFRFKNYASTGTGYNPSFNSNCDYWNIDYIYINKNRTFADTIPEDVTIADQYFSFFDEYSTVPWKHFLSNNDIYNDSLTMLTKNLDDEQRNTNRQFVRIFDNDNIALDSISFGQTNIEAFEDLSRKAKIARNYFTSSEPDSAHFTILSFISTGTSESLPFTLKNDTLSQQIYFKNEYAYDDGTAENGFGISGTGTQSAKLALKFAAIKGDTLRGINMFFNQTVNNASQKYFYLTVWGNSSSDKPGTVLYQKTGYKPEYAEGYNQFYYYELDTPIYVNGTFYVGWQQTTTDLLNVGFDVNSDFKHKTFINYSGTWTTSIFTGVPMIRPVFSEEPILSVNNFENKTFSIYPNPANEVININGDYIPNTKIEIMDLYGRICFSNEFSNHIDVSSLKTGIYFIRISNQQILHTSKIIISR